MTSGGQYTMERSFGLPPAATVRAADQLQKSYPSVGLQDLPTPYAPGATNAARIGIQDAEDISFLMIGDSGGVKDAEFQVNVASAMVNRLVENPKIAFAYHVGDEVYFNGDSSQYDNQFYEAYSHFNRPICGVPGNHDGDTTDDATRQPLDTFMANFCSTSPMIPPSDPQFEHGRHTQMQPSHDWTLSLQFITIIGLYSNVPSGGHLFPQQIGWLQSELKVAPTGIPLMVVLHHPPYSVDAHHGGSVKMGVILDDAFNATGRYPDIVMSGHVHNYQRFTRNYNGQYITYGVIGNSGYHHLHSLASDAQAGEVIPSNDGAQVTFNYGDASNWGFLEFSVAGGVLSGQYHSVDRNGNTLPASQLDSFRVGAAA